jgi:hypothetical protein
MDAAVLGVLDARDNADGSGMDLRRTARIKNTAATPAPDTILFNGRIFTAAGFDRALAMATT